jgi:hypothetical protein
MVRQATSGGSAGAVERIQLRLDDLLARLHQHRIQRA